MIFRPELAEKVMDGRKTVTRRLCSENPRSPWWRGGCALEVGRDYAVQPKRGVSAIGRVRILSVRREQLVSTGIAADLDREAWAEGFASFAEFRAAWQEINGLFDPLAEVWRVEFEVLR